MPSDISQSQKDKYHIIPLYEVLRVGKIIGTESRMVVTSSWGEGRMRSYYLIGTEFHFYKIKEVTEMDGWLVGQHYECI